jgi:drug/metabolite transporter (DMT)-like permease
LVGVFAVAAFFSPLLARIALYRGFATLGLSRPTVASSTSALFAVILAVLFLGEPMTLWIGVGTVAVVLGVGLLAYEKFPRTSWRKIHLIYPLFAAFCFGARDAVARYGVKGFASPLVAAAITTTIAWVMLSHLFFLKGGPFRFRIEPSGLLPLLSAGFFYVMAYYALFATLSREYLVIVAPAIHSSTFFTLVLSYLFIRREERISPRLVLGALFVVLGVTVVTLARRGL